MLFVVTWFFELMLKILDLKLSFVEANSFFVYRCSSAKVNITIMQNVIRNSLDLKCINITLFYMVLHLVNFVVI